MKIALLVHDYGRSGGHSRYVAELAQRFAAEHDVHVFANTFEREPGITFHKVPAYRANALTLILTFRHHAARMLRGMRFDIVHDQGLCTWHPDVITAHIVNRAWSRARPGANWKDRLFSGAAGVLERLQFSRAQVIAVSERIRRDLKEHYGVEEPVTVIHHGVNAQLFQPANRARGPEPVFLFVGDFRKGLEAAIRALDGGRLLCVGSTPPEPYRQLARQLGREDRVEFHPATNAVEQYYARADVLLLPTPYDAFGMVVLEAMAAALPVVVSHNAGASELIRHGVNGFILQDEEELPALMKEAAVSNVGAAARETALAHSWDRVAGETLEVYGSALAAPRVLAFATQGAGGNDEGRLRELLSRHHAHWFSFRRSSAPELFRRIWKRRYPLVVMEGTGIAGGVPLIAARLLNGQRYVVSSGDAVTPFVAQRQPLLAPLFAVYERLLYRFAAGFIGWSPYLTGRALTFGVPRAVTAAGWAAYPFRSRDGALIRAELGIPAEAVVIGIVGSLAWTPRVRYCYGLELVEAARRTSRPDLRFLIIGEGTGRPELQRRADGRVIVTGQVPRNKIPAYLAAMDIASLPQSCDGVGSFRYTTKLSEYLAAGLPVITGQIPAAYDLDEGWLWRLPGDAPWTERYVRAMAALLEKVSPGQIAEKRSRVPEAPPLFNREAQVGRVTALLDDILGSTCE